MLGKHMQYRQMDAQTVKARPLFNNRYDIIMQFLRRQSGRQIPSYFVFNAALLLMHRDIFIAKASKKIGSIQDL